MVNLDIVRSSNAKLVQEQPLVAVFVGGTSGIGEYSLRALAATVAKSHGKGLRAYIVGRNKNAAETIISDCINVYPDGQFRFIAATDLSLLKDVDRVCTEILKAEEEASTPAGQARIDFLVLTQGYLTFSFEDTKEGLDAVMSLMYYSRMRFIIQLLPLLLKSSMPAHIVSVVNPNLEGKLNPNDLALRKPGSIGVSSFGSHTAHMNSLFMEQLAVHHSERLALIHLYPGFVKTNIGANAKFPKWLVWIWIYLFEPLFSSIFVPNEECGERVVFLASPRYPAHSIERSDDDANRNDGAEVAVSPDGTIGGGFYRVNWNGNSIAARKAQKVARKGDIPEKVWEHTMNVFKVIESGGKLTG